MGAYLITGRSGTGKTTVCKELQRQGYCAFDMDRVEGLAGWVNPKTGSPVKVDYSKPMDLTQNAWHWNAPVLSKLLATHDELFMCGSAHNQLDFHYLFDKVFVLVLPPKTQRRRIMERTEHDYGKLPEMQTRLLAEQAEFVKQSVALGTLKVAAAKTPEKIVQDILTHVHAH
ncbi:MAG TPA: AAA family ATPase [Candidatus Saccharimonadales bacterium]|nr:AAA family ATPase [Candidatus Saccharimonadales bacterium]